MKIEKVFEKVKELAKEIGINDFELEYIIYRKVDKEFKFEDIKIALGEEKYNSLSEEDKEAILEIYEDLESEVSEPSNLVKYAYKQYQERKLEY